ncbi:hypothetical protein [Lacinutrix chionoecetis]
MLLKSTNIRECLEQRKRRDYTSSSLLEQVKEILQAQDLHNDSIIKTLHFGDSAITNAFNFDLLRSEHIFHINTIKATCIAYRLRFLDTKYFKNEFPQEAITKIKDLEKEHNTTLKGFKIMAPSKLFKLKKPDDPLLFAPIGNGYFYLVHKWGNDLHPLRKWLMLPFRNFETLLVTALCISLLITYLCNGFSSTIALESSKFFILFLFMFKSVIGVIIFYAISQKKNFNTVIWDSMYN